MSNAGARWRRMSRGEGNIKIILVVVAVGIIFFVGIKMVGVYRAKWALEHNMQIQMTRLASIGEDELKGIIGEYCKNQNIPLDPDDCTFVGQPGDKGTMTCPLVMDVDFILFRKVFSFQAEAEVEKIPMSSF